MRISGVALGTKVQVVFGQTWTKFISSLMSTTAFVRPVPQRCIVVVVGSLLMSFIPTLSQATDNLPNGGIVVAGQANIGGAANGMLITQSSKNAIINWNGFSIGAGKNVTFQNGTGATLNRVTGTGASFINGRLTATGSLFLINQNGVIIGKSGVINTGGSFIASTLDVTNGDFLNGGDLTFAGNSNASVINLGKVSSLGGDVAFIAHTVVNEGSISAPNGTAALLAGREVLMRDAALNDGKFVVKLGDATSSVTEAGMIAAASVELRANGGNVYALAGNKGGAINATGVTNSGGRIFLTASGGRVTVNKRIKAKRNNGAGGNIFINANIVSIANLLDVSSAAGQGGKIDIGASDTITLASATLGASGYTGGGSIRVGGEYQGGKYLSEDEVQNVQTLLIDELTTLKADGTGNNADGGKIIMWADGDTTFNGSASATAIGNGTGGFVETSAAYLHIGNSARVTTLSESGNAGTWLLDPGDFIVSASGGDMTGAQLSGWLNSTSIGILTSLISGPGNGDIFINDAIAWSSDNRLELVAERNVEINADVTATGTNAGLVVTYGAGGEYIFGAGGKVTLSGANASLAINGQAYTLIHNVNQLQDMNNDRAGHYALAEDIDASATATWNTNAGFVSVGDSTTKFTGNFNGHGHTISELFIDRSGTNNVGLFGYTRDATIANVGMVDGSIIGADNVGGLVGLQVFGSITNAYATGAVSGENYVGGLVGWQQGDITNAYATGAVSGDTNVGGLVAAQFAGSSITNAYATGTVSGDDYVGGLVGYSSTSITNAYATGAVLSKEFVGGLVGYQDGTGRITNAYATGVVSGDTNVGGLVGYQDGTSSSTSPYTGRITNAYATGAVSGNTFVGGLIGSQLGNITNSYWDVDTTGQANASGTNTGTQTNVVGLTNAQAFDVSSYAGWSIGTTIGYSVPAGDWLMIDGETRPFLAFEYSTEIANAHQLQLMAFDLNADYNLVADIDASHTNGATHPSQMWSARGFVPVGTFPNNFIGDFNGHDHTISELFINRPGTNYVGLFSSVENATIANVGMVGGSITGSFSVGGLVGLQFSGDISNAYATGAVSGDRGVGGLVGYQLGSGSITNAYATGAVSGVTSVGGLVGWQDGNISNAYATGAVSGTNQVGGLVGHQVGSIIDAYATGAVSGDRGVGGLVGYQLGSGSITDAYATGAVSGVDIVGGLVGWQDGSIVDAYATGAVTADQNVGGLVGAKFGSGSISNAYATGAVLGDIRVGGLVGAQFGSGSISNAYATGAVTGNTDVGGLVGNQRSGSSIIDAHATGAVSGTNQVGGLVGRQYGSIIDAYATGAVSGDAYVGGLVGAQIDGSIFDAYATGTVSGDIEVGGLVGVQLKGSIIDAYATGAVSAKVSVGGLVGYQNGSMTNAYATGTVSGDIYVGGLVGEQSGSGSITKAYATGAVTGNTLVGGLIGNQRSGGSITNSFWDVDTTGRANAVGNLAGSISGTTGLHTTEFQDTAGFMSQASGWDFENVWAPPSNGYYPELYALSQVVWVKLNDVSREYGEANPALTVAGTYGGPDIYVFGPVGDVLSFSPTLSTATDTSSSVGSYAIIGIPSSVTSAKGQNYRVVYSGDLTVTPVALIVTPVAPIVTPATPTVMPVAETVKPAPDIQTGVFISIEEGFGQSIECAQEGLLSCELVEAQF